MGGSDDFYSFMQTDEVKFVTRAFIGVAGAALIGVILFRSFFLSQVRDFIKGKVAQRFEAAGLVVGRDIVIHDDNAFLEWATNGSLGFGESYMTKAWDSGKIPLDEIVTRMARLPAEKKRQFKPWNWRLVSLYNRLFNLQSVNRADIIAKRHYDLGNDFFRKWLDKNMQYSCAYWKGVDEKDGGDGLDQAQLNKMRLIAEKLQLKPGMTVVDIGNGWGTLDCFLAEQYGVHVTGINISKEQVKFAKELAEQRGLSHKTNFILDDYRNLTGQFDRLVSVGSLEHVGYKNLPGFFDLVARSLKPEGIAVVQCITVGKTVPAHTDQWIHKYIFPNGYLPSPKLLIEHVEAKLVVEDVQNFGLDYMRTLQAWLKRFRKCVEAGELSGDKQDETFIRMWEYYLQYCTAGFRARIIHLYQVVYSKKRAERYDAPR